MQAEKLNLATLSPLFADEEAARKFLESQKWPNGPVCPHCGSTKAYPLTAKAESKKPVRKGVYCCAKCRKQFTVRIGTIFEDSHIPLNKWLMAFHLMSSSKKGISSMQLHRELGITLKSAWFLSHRIRESMMEKHEDLLTGTVEVDETYVGGKPRKGSGPHKRGRGTDKAPVMVLVERDGKARTSRVDRVTGKELKGVIKTHVDHDSKIVTDEFLSYRGISNSFTGGHSVVHHSSEQFVNEEGEHTNTAESFFALLKRGHYGIFHSLSKQHLFRYCNKFAFRWNYRKVDDGERMIAAIKGVEGKRLMYRKSVN
ncbi:MAG: IS1595 family transposase [Desulfomonilaceae bacterium]